MCAHITRRKPRTQCQVSSIAGAGVSCLSLRVLGDGRRSAPPGAPGRPMCSGGDQVRPFAVREAGADRRGAAAIEGKRLLIMHKRSNRNGAHLHVLHGQPRLGLHVEHHATEPARTMRARLCVEARRAVGQGSWWCGGQRAWLSAHVWSSWSLVSQVKLSWTSSPAHASSWSTPSTGAALAMLLLLGMDRPAWWVQGRRGRSVHVRTPPPPR